jgi:hypothetical protein
VDEYDGDHDIPPEQIRARLSWLIAEGTVIRDEARTMLDVLAPMDRLRGIGKLYRDRRDEWDQWERYARPRTRVGRLVYAVAMGLARWARAVG